MHRIKELNLNITSKKTDLGAKTFRKGGKYLVGSLKIIILSVILSYTYSLVSDSPEENFLKQESSRNAKSMSMLKSEIDSLNLELAKIQEKDDHLYRLLLGTKPLNPEIRKAGFGGAIEEANPEVLPNELSIGSYRIEINQLAAKISVQAASFDLLTRMAEENSKCIAHRPSISPLSPADLIRLSSGFGYRTHPIFKIRKFHKGIDLTALKGSPIYSTAKGTVIIAANYNDGYGNKVVVDNGYGYETIYAHLNKILVHTGQELELGELIGQVGNTGISQAPHLHYEIRYHGQAINPLKFIYKDISASEYALITEKAKHPMANLD
jgi:murein DD-endopeptidase MepM/ murein hydrolase activator NlpD